MSKMFRNIIIGLMITAIAFTAIMCGAPKEQPETATDTTTVKADTTEAVVTAPADTVKAAQ